LLHDLGKLLLAANLPEIYVQILEQGERTGLPVIQVEKDILDGSHGELAACLLCKWGFARVILEAIAWHNSPAKSADSEFSPLTAVHVANAFARETPSTTEPPVTEYDFDYLDRIGLKNRCSLWREACGLIAKNGV